ncbi:Major facilitator superfamily (MFS) [Carpediemonas membranifera]|uniref:Major facilitator superfamily (MFS) n=1 Tax=Carpediemonas membranifera TaxID=201153 RepID=A0A8J6AZ32_9EUKA|nr:Major facilitator superfamily (MFS) [Carpediemonas membranifera]|eukprot:KAG9389477.1 Major facilitator superfamily (MFS) [Carpediemonas membranifera]
MNSYADIEEDSSDSSELTTESILSDGNSIRTTETLSVSRTFANIPQLPHHIAAFFSSPLGKNLVISLLLMVSIAGMEIEWAGVYSWASSTLLEHGASGELSTLPFQLSPIISVIIIPIAGALSDRFPKVIRYRYGSRRLILTVSILLCGACALCVPLTSGTIFPSLPSRFIIASQLFLNTLLDILNKFIESFIRALVGTVADPRLESINHVLTTAILGFAMIFGFQATSIPLNKWLPVGHTMNLYYPIGVVIFFITAIPVFFSKAEARACARKDNVEQPTIKDIPLLSVAQEPDSPAEVDPDAISVKEEGRKKTSWVRVGLVLLWCMAAFYSGWTAWVFNPEFLGVDIYHGDPHAHPNSVQFKKYEEGASLAGTSDSIISLGVMLSAFIWLALDALLARVLGRFRTVLFGAMFNVILLVGLIMCAFAPGLLTFAFAQVLIGLGFGGSTNFVFSRAAHYTHISDVGLVNTLVFSAETLPQMLMTVSGTMAVGLTGSYRTPYILGAVPLLLTIPLTLVL